jgi:hypothetical protein
MVHVQNKWVDVGRQGLAPYIALVLDMSLMIDLDKDEMDRHSRHDPVLAISESDATGESVPLARPGRWNRVNRLLKLNLQ